MSFCASLQLNGRVVGKFKLVERRKNKTKNYHHYYFESTIRIYWTNSFDSIKWFDVANCYLHSINDFVLAQLLNRLTFHTIFSICIHRGHNSASIFRSTFNYAELTFGFDSVLLLLNASYSVSVCERENSNCTEPRRHSLIGRGAAVLMMDDFIYLFAVSEIVLGNENRMFALPHTAHNNSI